MNSQQVSGQPPTTSVTGHRTGSRTLGFQSLDEELRIDDLAVTGEFPHWLSGSAMRVTPALLDIAGAPVGHWFDGLAMLNVFSFSRGQVSYANSFLKTQAYQRARQGKRDLGISMATDPCRHVGQRLVAAFDRRELVFNPAVSVAKLGERFIASTEAPVPVSFNPEILQVTDNVDLRRDPRELHGDFAHPHFDGETGHMITYVTRYSARNTHQVIAIDPHSLQRTTIAKVPAGREPEYMHSFGLSENYIVLIRQPLAYSLPPIARSGKFQDGYRWHPERGTRFTIIDRNTGEVHDRYSDESFFFWHQANTFERDGELVCDVVASDDPSSVWDLDLVKLRNPEHRPAFHGELRRYRVPLTEGKVRRDTLCANRMEFPQVNYERVGGRDYRYVYGVAYGSSRSDWFDEIVKINVRDGSVLRWAEDACYPSEPMYVSSPGATAEDAGVVLNIVLDARAGRSFLLALDATTFTELARAQLPHHIPFNFHQHYFS